MPSGSACTLRMTATQTPTAIVLSTDAPVETAAPVSTEAPVVETMLPLVSEVPNAGAADLSRTQRDAGQPQSDRCHPG